ncbi:MAG: ABC transporter permease subunit [Chloroflexi bacterium]|nr:ABC transporter permease subunit [Chloroflexota bacterium]
MSVLIVLFVFYLIDRALDLDLGFGFLSGPGGFAIAQQWVTDYQSSDTRWDAYLVGIVNTVRLILIGIVFAMVLGTLMGLARLSSNWLVSTIASVYVETIRNIPLLIQIIFLYTAVLLQLPRISDTYSAFDIFYLNNRSLALPFFDADGSAGIWFLLVALSAVAAWAVSRSLKRREESSGSNLHPMAMSFAVFILLAAITFVITGSPLNPDAPSLMTTGVGVQNIQGGLQVTPEFAAVLLGLVIYTSSFIAEIIRGSIQALPGGQNEAAAALGLNFYQRMTLIVLPQAMRIAIPPLTNQFLNLTKNSSLAVAIAYPEMVLIGSTIINGVGHAVPMFILIWATYLAMSLLISIVMNTLNNRVQLAGR